MPQECITWFKQLTEGTCDALEAPEPRRVPGPSSKSFPGKLWAISGKPSCLLPRMAQSEVCTSHAARGPHSQSRFRAVGTLCLFVDGNADGVVSVTGRPRPQPASATRPRRKITQATDIHPPQAGSAEEDSPWRTITIMRDFLDTLQVGSLTPRTSQENSCAGEEEALKPVQRLGLA